MSRITPELAHLGLVVNPGAPMPIELVAACTPWCRVGPYTPAPPDAAEPDAILVTDPDAPLLAPALASGLPVALMTDSLGRVPAQARGGRVTLVLTNPGDADTPDGTQADPVVIPPDAIRASMHPPITPFVRSRWREARGLSPDLVARVGVPDPWPAAEIEIPTALALAAAAIVTGPWLSTALALGTPVVTTAAEAARVGAEPGIALVTATTDAFDDDAAALVADRPRATALGWGARWHVETHLDLDMIAIEMLETLGIGPRPFPAAPLARLDTELARLGTPTWSSVRARALGHAAPLTGSTDFTLLTGSTR